MIVILFEIVRYITVTVEIVMIVILFEIVRYIAVTDEILLRLWFVWDWFVT